MCSGLFPTFSFISFSVSCFILFGEGCFYGKKGLETIHLIACLNWPHFSNPPAPSSSVLRLKGKPTHTQLICLFGFFAFQLCPILFRLFLCTFLCLTFIKVVFVAKTKAVPKTLKHVTEPWFLCYRQRNLTCICVNVAIPSKLPHSCCLSLLLLFHFDLHLATSLTPCLMMNICVMWGYNPWEQMCAA